MTTMSSKRTERTKQRHTRRHPCPICGGGDDDPRGQGIRCDGFTSADGTYAHCSREDRAGKLSPDPNGRTFAHRLNDSCACGLRHAAGTDMGARSARQHQALLPQPRRVYQRYDQLPEHLDDGSRLVALYPYHDDTGQVAYEVRRYEPKTFRIFTQCRVDETWVAALEAPRVLYRLPRVLAAPPATPIYICEGEKAVDGLQQALHEAGIPGVATTTLGGSHSGELTPLDALIGRRVVILPDNDDDGEHYQEVMAQRTRAVGAAVVAILRLDGLPAKGDIVEWLGAGHTAEELTRLASEAIEAIEAQVPFAPVGVRLSDVQPEPLQWLWPGYIPLGKITLFEGDPGLGKSTLMADLTARVTRGLRLPDGSPCPAGGVVLLSAEDDAADTIRPRLDAAGADAARVYQLTGVQNREGDETIERDFILPADLPILEMAIQHMDARLVIVDPLMAFLSGDVNSHRDQDVRGALRPLAALAARTGAAIVLVRHLNKAQGMSAMYRGGGSIGIIGAARSALLVAPDPDDPESDKPSGRRVLAIVKTNLSAAAPSLIYHVVSADNGVGRIEWGGASARTANELTSHVQDADARTLTEEAIDYLQAFLAEGPRPKREVDAEAPRDIRGTPLRTAAARLGIKKQRVGFGKQSHVEWSLPANTDVQADVQNAHRCYSTTIDAITGPIASMVDDDIYGADSRVCPHTGGAHVTAKLRTADGWLRCIECDQVTNRRAEEL